MPLRSNELIRVERDTSGSFLKAEMVMPSDLHNHFRQDALAKAITPVVSWPYKHMLAMPNTKPPITTPKQARQYKEAIEIVLRNAAIHHCSILPTIYLCAATLPSTIEAFAEVGLRPVVKSYPPGGTTNSDDAVPLLTKQDVLSTLKEVGGTLLIHGESVTDTSGNTLPHEQREEYFMNSMFITVREKNLGLRICLEHITTRDGVERVKADKSGNTVCTITPQHMLLTSEAFGEIWGGVHARCMPYLKSEDHRACIAAFATSGDRRAILGTDCAPHILRNKEKPFEEAMCGCYTPHALAMYAKVFEDAKALDERFAQFASLNGPRWWGLKEPTYQETITLLNTGKNSIPEPTPVPDENDIVVPLGWTKDFNERMALEFALEHKH
jgi:dihydroorotase